MKAKHDDRVLVQAKESGVPLKTEYEFTAELISKPVICITGTNGKSSTAVLLAEMLGKSGKKTYITVIVNPYIIPTDEKNMSHDIGTDSDILSMLRFCILDYSS